MVLCLGCGQALGLALHLWRNQQRERRDQPLVHQVLEIDQHRSLLQGQLNRYPLYLKAV